MTNTYPPSDPSDQSPLFTDTARQARTFPLDEEVDVTITSVDSPDTTASSGGEGAAGSSKQAASDVGHDAKQATTQVAGTARDEAGKVASEVKSQAKDLFQQTRGELGDQAATQQKRVAEGLRSVGDELQSMSGDSTSGGLATELVGQAATRLQGVAGWLDDRDPGSLVSEVRQFASRRPGAFIGIAAVAGLLAGRLTKGLISDAHDHADTTTDGTVSAASTTTTRVAPLEDRGNPGDLGVTPGSLR